MVEMLGLSKADIEELKVDSLSLFIKLLSETIYFQEVSDSAVTAEDLDTMREVLARMSDEELQELAEMDHQQLDQFYKEHVEAVKRSRRHVKNDDHDHSNSKEVEHTVYVGIAQAMS